jgi:hypothetical protein
MDSQDDVGEIAKLHVSSHSFMIYTQYNVNDMQ